MNENKKEFYSSTVSGTELRCMFAFPKIFYTRNPKDIDDQVYYDIGFLAEIGWSFNNSASAKHSLNSINPIEINSGVSILEGQAVFKIFHRDSLEVLKTEILKGINSGGDKIELPFVDDNPFITLEEEAVWENVTSDPDKVNWSQMPLFDIILLSNTQDELFNKVVRKKTIRGVKFTSDGFSESIESLEANSIASFIAVGGVTDWEVEKIDV